MKNKFLGMALLMGLLLSACGGGNLPVEPQVTAPAMSVLITETNCPSMEIQSGTQVAWSNKGTQVHMIHIVSADDGSLLIDSGELPIGGSFTFTFLEPGVYTYQCTPDGTMTGTITVR